MSDSERSITLMLSRLKGGDELAAQLIWERFFDRLRSLAAKKLGTLRKTTVDEEDIALSAINALCVGAQDGRFAKLEDRDDLWQILCMITSRKSASAWRKQIASKETGESILVKQSDDDKIDLEQIAQASPDDGFVNSLSLVSKELLEGLDERLQDVAILKLQGFANQEIADKIGRSVKSVERYLKTIREEWNWED